MSPVNPRQEPAQVHRPLPSMPMPLLRGERRRSRARQVAGIAGVIATVAAGAAGVTVYSTMHATGGEPAASAKAPSSSVSARRGSETLATSTQGGSAKGASNQRHGNAYTQSESQGKLDELGTGAERQSKVHRFGKARTFREAIARAGLSAEEASSVEGALEGVLDFRRCRPADTITISRDEHDKLTGFKYQSTITEYYSAQRNGSGKWVGRKVKTPIERTTLTRGGVVNASLGESLVGLGLNPSVVGLFVEIFSGRADFSVDVRQGDTYRILVEEERIKGKFVGYSHAKAVEYRGKKTGTLRAFWYKDKRVSPGYFDEDGREMHGGWMRTPLRYDRISSKFDPKRRHPILKRIVPHFGVDYAAATGTLVWAAADGKVRFAGVKGANGKLVSIRHPNGFETHYAHLSRIERGIKAGTSVKYRQPIGYVGSTGRSTGPHLHFGVKRGGRHVDPLKVLSAPGKLMPRASRARYKRHVRSMKRKLRRIRVKSSS